MTTTTGRAATWPATSLAVRRALRVAALPGLLALAVPTTAGCAGGSTAAPSSTPASTPASAAPVSAGAPEATTPTIPSPSQVPNLDPEQRDDAFARALATRNLQVGDEQTRTQVASSVCSSLDSGVPLPTLIDALRQSLGGPTPENTGFIVGAATAIYCPENLPKLKTR